MKMSCTELYYITTKKRVYLGAEFHNSHRGAAFVWSNLWKEFCKDRIEEIKRTQGWECTLPMSENDNKLVWKLYERSDIPEYIRAILGSTFDDVILEAKHFQRFYDDVLKYAENFAAGTLIQQAQYIILKLSRRNIIGVCWNQTSVNADGYSNILKAVKNDTLWSLYDEIESRRLAAAQLELVA
jgi:hypothetical protein